MYSHVAVESTTVPETKGIGHEVIPDGIVRERSLLWPGLFFCRGVGVGGGGELEGRGRKFVTYCHGGWGGG